VQVWGFAIYALAYLALFAIPLLAKKDSQLRAGPALKLAAVSGLLLTLLYVVFSIVPIVDVANRLAYAAKTVGVLLGANAVALALFYSQMRRRRELPQ
jgi:hypothetical protein